MSERLLLRISRNSAVVKTNELIVSHHVVLLPGYGTVFVYVKLLESLLCIIQSIFSVDVLNPLSDLLCRDSKRADRV